MCGVSNGRTQLKLLCDNHINIFENACKIVMSLELAEEKSNLLQEAPVNKIGEGKFNMKVTGANAQSPSSFN